jgi:tRNA nucleotidyltransferase/poly(A) polymerase
MTGKGAATAQSGKPTAATVALAEGAAAPLLRVLDRDEEEARIVGGAVRNALLGEPIGDIDIATTATPDEVIRRVEAAGFKAVPTGVDHGTVTVVVAGRPFEVTTLRQDVETFGRKATVRFGRDWRADAERRDFTMNALSIKADGALCDDVGGLADLGDRRVRFIGDPAARIAEDYLRILRFFRFHAAYGEGALDTAGLHACIAARAGLDRLSRERVRMELLKLLVARNAVPVLTVMSDAGLLLSILGGVVLVPAFTVMRDCEAALSLAPDAIRRLGALAVLIPEDAERLSERLRLANAGRDRLVSMGDGWWRIAPHGDEHDARTLLYWLGPERYCDRALMAWAHATAEATDADWIALATLSRRWTAPAFPLKAADFIARGVQRGPALGAAMRAAEEAWIAAGFPSDPTELDRLADRAAAASDPSAREQPANSYPANDSSP